MQTTTKTSRKYLATPIFGVAMGVVYLVALSVAGQPVWAWSSACESAAEGRSGWGRSGWGRSGAVQHVGVVAEVHPRGLQ